MDTVVHVASRLFALARRYKIAVAAVLIVLALAVVFDTSPLVIAFRAAVAVAIIAIIAVGSSYSVPTRSRSRAPDPRTPEEIAEATRRDIDRQRSLDTAARNVSDRQAREQAKYKNY